MEPLSITTTCIGLVSTITRTSLVVVSFVKDVRAARSDLDSVSHELLSLKTVLELLAEDVDDSQPQSIPQTLQKQITGIVANCSGVVVDIEQTLKKHEGGKLSKAAKWVASGKSDVAKLQLSLEAHKSALEIALDMVTLTLAKEIKADTHEILNDTSAIKEDTAQILAEIARLQAQLPRDGDQRDAGFMLERYLDNLTSYAETVCDSYPDGSDGSRPTSRPRSSDGNAEVESPSTPTALQSAKPDAPATFQENEEGTSGSQKVGIEEKQSSAFAVQKQAVHTTASSAQSPAEFSRDPSEALNRLIDNRTEAQSRFDSAHVRETELASPSLPQKTPPPEDLVYARNTEDFLRHYPVPRIPLIQETMVKPAPSLSTIEEHSIISATDRGKRETLSSPPGPNSGSTVAGQDPDSIKPPGEVTYRHGVRIEPICIPGNLEENELFTQSLSKRPEAQSFTKGQIPNIDFTALSREAVNEPLIEDMSKRPEKQSSLEIPLSKAEIAFPFSRRLHFLEGTQLQQLTEADIRPQKLIDSLKEGIRKLREQDAPKDDSTADTSREVGNSQAKIRKPSESDEYYEETRERLDRFKEGLRQLEEFQEQVPARGDSTADTSMEVRKSRPKARKSRERVRHDDREQSNKIGAQKSQFSSLSQVDAKKRQLDRKALMTAAQRNVTKSLHEIDKKVFADTGKVAPSLLSEWEVKPHAAVQAKSDTRMEKEISASSPSRNRSQYPILEEAYEGPRPSPLLTSQLTLPSRERPSIRKSRSQESLEVHRSRSTSRESAVGYRAYVMEDVPRRGFFARLLLGKKKES